MYIVRNSPVLADRRTNCADTQRAERRTTNYCYYQVDRPCLTPVRDATKDTAHYAPSVRTFLQPPSHVACCQLKRAQQTACTVYVLANRSRITTQSELALLDAHRFDDDRFDLLKQLLELTVAWALRNFLRSRRLLVELVE